jgi:hypothetical protein
MPSQPFMLALFFQKLGFQLLFDVVGQHHLRKVLPGVLDAEKFA